MPLYEYRCTECGEEFEVNLRFSEADKLPPCPKCESAKTKKKISRVASFNLNPSGAGASSGAVCSPGGYT